MTFREPIALAFVRRTIRKFEDRRKALIDSGRPELAEIYTKHLKMWREREKELAK